MNANNSHRRVWIVWIVFVGLVAVVGVSELRDRSQLAESVGEQAAAGAERARMLLPVPVAQLRAIEIGYSGALHRFERDATGAWFHHGAHARAAHAHQSDPAQAQVVDKAFVALARARMERRFKPNMQLNIYGLASPQMVILIYGKDNAQPLAQYAVGDIAPDGVSRYVLPAGSSYVVTIANYQIDNVIALVTSFASELSE